MKKAISPYYSGEITLRMLEEGDLPLTLSWRNNSEIRKWFKNSDEIAFDSHCRWFESYESKLDDYVFIAEHNGTLVGQLAVYDIREHRAEVGRFISSPEMKGKGIMKQSIRVFLDFIIDAFELNEINLEVYESNVRAVAVYRKLGFETIEIKDGIMKMRLTHAE